MIALLVGIINGVFDIAYNMQRTFEASVTNDYGESLSVKVVADSGRPPFLWYLAWRVGNNPVTTVNIGIMIIPSGTNIGNLKVTYYIKGVSGANSKKFLSATSLSATSGQQITNSTGNVDIDTHLSQLGLSTTQDQTVNYIVYCKVEGTGLISGETLVAEVAETQFDSVFYDYGIEATGTVYPIDDSYVRSDKPGTNYDGNNLYTGIYLGVNYRAFIKFNLTDYPGISQASLHLFIGDYFGSTGTHDFTVYEVDDDSWTETSITWNNQPTVGSSISTVSINVIYAQWHSWDVTSYAQLEAGSLMSLCLKENPANLCYGAVFCDREHSADPYLELTYLDYSANWSWFNLPLSVVSLPIGQQFLAIVFMILAFAVWAVAREKKRKRRKKR